MLRGHLEDKGNDGPAQVSTANNTPNLKYSTLNAVHIVTMLNVSTKHCCKSRDYVGNDAYCWSLGAQHNMKLYYLDTVNNNTVIKHFPEIY